MFRRQPPVPAEVDSALALARGDRVLAWAQEVQTGAHLVASVQALHHVGAAGAATARGSLPASVAAAGSATWSRPWRDVAAGAWEPRTRTLTATWADGSRAAMWTFADSGVRLPAVFHDRVQASVYIAVPLVFGEREVGRVALRRDFATGGLVEQVSLRPGVSATDPEVASYVAEALALLREQAGL